MQRDNKHHLASLAVTSIATLTTNYVRWTFLLAHAVACQEIPPGEHRFTLRNLVDEYLRLEIGKSSCERSDNSFCREVYGTEIRRSKMVGSHPGISSDVHVDSELV